MPAVFILTWESIKPHCTSGYTEVEEVEAIISVDLRSNLKQTNTHFEVCFQCTTAYFIDVIYKS